jgi:hypothetical protein
MITEIGEPWVDAGESLINLSPGRSSRRRENRSEGGKNKCMNKEELSRAIVLGHSEIQGK